MKVQFLDLLQGVSNPDQVSTSLTIVPFVDFLRRKITEKNNLRQQFFEHTLETILEIPEWDKEITPDNIARYQYVFNLVYFTFAPPVVNEAEDAWALAKPFSGTLFFGTDSFYNLLTFDGISLRENLFRKKELPESLLKEKKIIYSLILERFYKFNAVWKSEIIYAYQDDTTGLNRYYKLTFDNQFVKVGFDGTPPQIDFTSFKITRDIEEENLPDLQKILPLEHFHFEGFSIVRVADITLDYAMDHIRDLIVNPKPGYGVYDDVSRSLQNTLGKKTIDIKLLPMLKINNHLAFGSSEDTRQYLDAHCVQYDFDRSEYLSAVRDYTEHPQIYFYPDLTLATDHQSKIVTFFANKGLRSVAIVPIFNHSSLVGIIEVLSRKQNELTAQCLAVLTHVIPLLKQLFQATIDNFEQTIDAVIRKNFTPLQSAIQWRFNEAAWHYLQQTSDESKNEIEHIYFPEVYPLYGAIDIRDSSKKRNQALQSDMYFRLGLLTGLLEKIKARSKMELTDELMSKASRWGSHILESITPELELDLLIFFKNEAEPLLSHFRNQSPQLDELIEEYFKAIEPGGKAYASRRDLEKSFQMVNAAISNDLEALNNAIQETYPCYFEKFRSDGIEYDIYAGQSIAPEKKFDTLFLKDLRLQQLSSMVKIARDLNHLIARLPKKLETTQLIFIHSYPIDISFRSDERRFDVEGAYNIRYQMVKKRIDKVHIKDSKERLTQPGKIALVYFQARDIEEYLSYISYLQGKDLLDEKIEYLDLEYLQGVSGLKALRVTVKI